MSGLFIRSVGVIAAAFITAAALQAFDSRGLLIALPTCVLVGWLHS